MRNILFVANEDSHIYYFHMNDIRLLEQQGFTVEIAALRGPFAKAIQDNKRVYHNVPFSRRPVGRGNISAFFQLLKLLRDKEYYMVHVHNVVASVVTRLAARLAGVKSIVYTAHGFPFHPSGNFLENMLYITAEKIMGYFTDYLIVMNSWDFEAAQKYKLVGTTNLFKVNGVGVDLKTFNFNSMHDVEEGRKRYGIREGVKVVGCVAELIPRKNHKMIIDAAVGIVSQFKEVVFVFVGDGSYKATLKTMVNKRGLDKHVIFAGRSDNVPHILSLMDILLLTSIYEGLPRSIQEGMAVGLPVVASNIRGNSDLITDGVNGYLVNLDDTDGLTEQLLNLLNDERLRRTIGENNKLKIKEQYSIELVENQLLNIYQKILGVQIQMQLRLFRGPSSAAFIAQ